MPSYEGGKGHGQGGPLFPPSIHDCIYPPIHLSVYLSIRHGREKDYEVEWVDRVTVGVRLMTIRCVH